MAEGEHLRDRPAVVRWFAEFRNKTVPPCSFGGADVYASYWGDWLLLAKTHLPHRFDDAVAVWVERQGFDQRGWRAVLNVVADDKSVGTPSPGKGTTTWRVGRHSFTHSGREHAGRWKVTRADDDAAPAVKKKNAKKTAAKKKPSS